jgi:hypothetical protein
MIAFGFLHGRLSMSRCGVLGTRFGCDPLAILLIIGPLQQGSEHFKNAVVTQAESAILSRIFQHVVVEIRKIEPTLIRGTATRARTFGHRHSTPHGVPRALIASSHYQGPAVEGQSQHKPAPPLCQAFERMSQISALYLPNSYSPSPPMGGRVLLGVR